VREALSSKERCAKRAKSILPGAEDEEGKEKG
jgi:hypothetical protein